MRLVLICGLLVILCSCSEPVVHHPLPDYTKGDIETDHAAHWLREDTLVLHSNAIKAYLLISKQAQLDERSPADEIVTLNAIDQPDWVKEKFPHLAGFYAFSVPLSTEKVKTALTQQTAVLQVNDKGEVVKLSYLQTGHALDDLYTANVNDADEVSDLGASYTPQQTAFKLWAPTAISVSVSLYDQDKTSLAISPIRLAYDDATGIWQGTIDDLPHGTFYRYQINAYHPMTQQIESMAVTDPYSLSLSTNSRYSQVVDLNHPDTVPNDWDSDTSPPINKPEDHIIYEAHVRDFSALDQGLPAEKRGTYGALSDENSVSRQHIQSLQQAGLNTLHLLPVFDISTVDERPGYPITLEDPLSKICEQVPDYKLCDSNALSDTSLRDVLAAQAPLTGQAQQLLEPLRSFDAYNWGYDPFHYTVPEGSYAQSPEGLDRLVEFRQMVIAVHKMGLRLVMDVVYNHTFDSGLNEKSVLDKVVPGYYHRRNPISGDIERSTCCENTATERRMMAKLMIDSLIVWTRDYHIDGFRFDLMGHQPKQAMLEAREAVQAIDPDNYFYGEGWDFGEVASNQRFVQASQTELAGTQIGTFTDRLRDAVRGGAAFAFGNEIRASQGLGNGLLLAQNEIAQTLPPEQVKRQYMLLMDQLRLGLAANLKEFTLQDRTGKSVTGIEIPYGNAPAGYAEDPADTINYVSKHDNQTLWDNHQYRLPSSFTSEQRARTQVLSLAFPLYAQGIPFIHMGSELLRSKSFLRDSFDFGDWFNYVDFSAQSNNYNVGLPPAETDEKNWPLIMSVIKGNQGRDLVSPSDIAYTRDAFIDMLKVRASSPLLKLSSAEEVTNQVKFLNAGPEQVPGILVMAINDSALDIDPEHDAMRFIFNHNAEPKTIALSNAASFRLHSAIAQGSDPVLKATEIGTDQVTVPGLSAVVLVK